MCDVTHSCVTRDACTCHGVFIRQGKSACSYVQTDLFRCATRPTAATCPARYTHIYTHIHTYTYTYTHITYISTYKHIFKYIHKFSLYIFGFRSPRTHSLNLFLPPTLSLSLSCARALSLSLSLSVWALTLPIERNVKGNLALFHVLSLFLSLSF